MTGRRARVLHAVLTAASVVLLVVAARRVDWRDTWLALRRASWGMLAAATVINLASLAAKGTRWWTLLRGAGVRSYPLVLRATFAGAGLNNVLPASGGEAARVLFVARGAATPSAAVLATLGLERLFDVVSFLVLGVAAAFLFPLGEDVERWRLPALLALVALAAGIAALLRWSAAHAQRAAELAALAALAAPAVQPTTDASAPLRERMRAHGGRFVRTVAAVTSPLRFAGALGLSLFAWATQLATYHLTARAAHLPVSLAASTAALLVVNVGFIVRTTPGNVGIFQLVYAFTLSHFGIPAEPAVAAALLLQALQVIPVTLIGLALAPEFMGKRRTADG